MQIDVIRPAATVSNAGLWTLTGGATLQAVTSDNSDASYAQDTSGGSGSQGSFVVSGTHAAPAAGHERHRFRFRLRESWAVPATGAFRGYAAGIPSSLLTWGSHSGIQDLPSVWDTSDALPATASIELLWSVQLTSATGTARVYELYADIDTREPPSFAAEVLDGAGVNRDAGIISDTSRPVFIFDSPDYDGLVSRSWTVEVRTVPGGVVVFSDSGTGTPPDVQSDPLPNGDYEADLQLFSTIRTNDAYASAVENVTFEVAFVAPAGPVLTVTPVLTPPAMDVDWTSDAPTATAWDVNADVVTELRRTDCNGTDTVVYVAQTGIGAATYLDRFMSLSYDGVFCGEEDHVCQVCYEARYWGLVDDVLVATDWSTEVCDTVANPNPGEAWIRGGDSGDLNVCPDESYGLARPFGVFQPIAGGMPTVITATPGGRNYTLSIPANSEADVVTLLGILAQAIVFYQPVAQADLWLAPDSHQVQVTKVGRNRVVDVPFTAVNPQPVVDPSSFF